MYVEIDIEQPTHMKDEWMKIPKIKEYTPALRIIEILMYTSAVYHTSMNTTDYMDKLRISYPNIKPASLQPSTFIIDLFSKIDAGVDEGYLSWNSEDTGTIDQIKEDIYAIIKDGLTDLFNEYNEGSGETFVLEYINTIVEAFSENIYQGIKYAYDTGIGEFDEDEED
jgi:hypothetical protein